MTRVVFFTVDEAIGGAEKMMLTLARLLRGRGFDVTLLTVKPVGRLHRLAADAGVPACSLGVSRRAGAALVPWRLYRVLRRLRPEILQTFLLAPNLFGRVVGAAAGVPVIIGGQRSTDPWRRWYHEAVDRLTAPLGQLVISNSAAGRQRLVARTGLSPRRVIVVPSGVPPARSPARPAARARFGFSAGDLVCGAVGVLRPAKDYHGLLGAFARVRAACPAARLAIAGRGPLRGELGALAAGPGLRGAVDFVGFLDDPGPFYAALDLFVLASRWEGMPAALLEAMSHGLPVVATAVSGVPEVVRDGVEGRLVRPGDSEQLAAALLELAGDPAARARLGAAARVRVNRHFSAETMADRYAAVYRRLAGGGEE